MELDSIDTICSVSELATLFSRSKDIQGFLGQIASIVGEHMRADNCSIYLYDPQTKRLILRACNGLAENAINNVHLKPGEGLTGYCFRRKRNILSPSAREESHYKHIPDIGEEDFQAYIGIPVIRGSRQIGVVNLRRKGKALFSKSEEKVLEGIVSQLSASLENVQILLSASPGNNTTGKGTAPVKTGKPEKISRNRIIRGTRVVEGVALGNAYLPEGRRFIDEFVTPETSSYVETLEGFRQALNRSEEQLNALQNRLEEEQADVASLIFSAHLLMLRDDGFSGSMERIIRNGTKPSRAVEEITNKYIEKFRMNENLRIREKIQDLKDLGHRILANLVQDNAKPGDYSGQIVITHELLPSELMKLVAQNVEGLVLLGGAVTAHVSVLARSLSVPMISAENEMVSRIPQETPLALNAHEGTLIINPDKATRIRTAELKTQFRNLQKVEIVSRPQTITADGERVFLRATINLLSDMKTARQLNAEGIGLYRSEFPFLIRSDFPSEEEQYLIYSKIVNGLENDLITLRTLDVGGDKVLSYFKGRDEANPFLGLRAIRFLLDNKKIFVGQLKAMIRAGGQKTVRILFPLISSLDDFLYAREYVFKSLTFLKRDGLGPYPVPHTGAMIELPSAVEMSPELALEADFLSLGTNDLVQYMLGVDRTNDEVADLFDIRHPAVFRAIKRVWNAANAANCPLSVCGIMAENPEMVYIMTGLGIREFSLQPNRIPDMQNRISRINVTEARRDAETISSLGSLKEVRKFLNTLKIGKILETEDNTCKNNNS